VSATPPAVVAGDPSGRAGDGAACAAAVGAVQRSAVRGPQDIVLPAGSLLEPAYLYSVATITNAAHAALGTELVAVEHRHAVIRLRRRVEHTEADGTWAPGVVAALADHVCSFTGVVALDDVAHFGGTMSLRVEHAAPCASTWLVARAWARPGPGSVLRVDGLVHAVDVPDDGEAGSGAVVQLVAAARANVIDLRLAP
jgi:acyl-coenzyme A thioesterase PaaI-like protein